MENKFSKPHAASDPDLARSPALERRPGLRKGGRLRFPCSTPQPPTVRPSPQLVSVELCSSRAADYALPLTNSKRHHLLDAQNRQPDGVEPPSAWRANAVRLETERRTKDATQCKE